jgi:hypothetical protein
LVELKVRDRALAAEDMFPPLDEMKHGGDGTFDLGRPGTSALPAPPNIFKNLKELSLRNIRNVLTQIATCGYVLPALETLSLSDVEEEAGDAYVAMLPSCFPALRNFELKAGSRSIPMRFYTKFLVDVLPTKFPRLEDVSFPGGCLGRQLRLALATNFVEIVAEDSTSSGGPVKFSRRL